MCGVLGQHCFVDQGKDIKRGEVSAEPRPSESLFPEGRSSAALTRGAKGDFETCSFTDSPLT